MPACEIRPGADTDLPALTNLYNHYVEHTPITFDTRPHTVESRRDWFRRFAETGPHRLMVAIEAGALLGYASATAFRPKPAYSTSVETSVYVAPESHGSGIGSSLYTALFEALAGEDLHRAYGGITLPNEPSIALHKRFGFRHIATYSEVGRKFGKYWDIDWFEKVLDQG